MSRDILIPLKQGSIQSCYVPEQDFLRVKSWSGEPDTDKILESIVDLGQKLPIIYFYINNLLSFFTYNSLVSGKWLNYYWIEIENYMKSGDPQDPEIDPDYTPEFEIDISTLSEFIQGIINSIIVLYEITKRYPAISDCNNIRRKELMLYHGLEFFRDLERPFFENQIKKLTLNNIGDEIVTPIYMSSSLDINVGSSFSGDIDGVRHMIIIKIPKRKFNRFKYVYMEKYSLDLDNISEHSGRDASEILLLAGSILKLKSIESGSRKFINTREYPVVPDEQKFKIYTFEFIGYESLENTLQMLNVSVDSIVSELERIKANSFGKKRTTRKTTKKTKSTKRKRKVDLAKKFRIKYKTKKELIEKLKELKKLHKLAKKRKIRITKTLKDKRVYLTINQLKKKLH